MSISLSDVVQLVPLALTVVALAYAGIRLRRPTRLAAIAILAGGLGPVLGVGLYLAVSRPSFNLVTALVGAAIALLLGLTWGRRPSTWEISSARAVRRPLLPIAGWTCAYLTGLALPVALASPEGRAGGALLLVLAAGLSAGASLAMLGSWAAYRTAMLRRRTG